MRQRQAIARGIAEHIAVVKSHDRRSAISVANIIISANTYCENVYKNKTGAIPVQKSRDQKIDDARADLHAALASAVLLNFCMPQIAHTMVPTSRARSVRVLCTENRSASW
jgi:hypothetical protein